MAIYTFGPGTLWGKRADESNPTPVKFGAIQEGSIEFNATVKQLYGQYQFPLAVGRGTSKIAGKVKQGQIQGRLFADLFFNETLETGQLTTANGEAKTIPGSPYTVAATHAADFEEDLGVIFTSGANNGIPLERVAAAPNTGQYSVNESTGSYTFAAADTTLGVALSYTYTVAGSGQKFTINNQLLGLQPVFQLNAQIQWSTKNAMIQLNRCISSKLTMPGKLEDFMIPEFDFEAFADDSGVIGYMSFNEAS